MTKEASIQQKLWKANHSPKIPNFRTRIEHEKMDRFIEYISIPEFAQDDVLFGTNILKLDSGEKIIVGTSGQKNVISSSIMRQYLDFCKEQELDAAKQRSLYELLKCVGPLCRNPFRNLTTPLQRVQRILIKVFSMMEGLADRGINVTTTQKLLNIRDRKKYLKNDFKTQIGRG